MANASGNFLKNTWYIIGWREELEQQPFVHRTIANEAILVYVLQSGALAAIGDRCPHRFVPLHLGKQVGDSIQCGYHGLCFGADGACVGTPAKSVPIPKAAKVKSYPVVDRYGAIWVWLGNPELADPERIPVFDFLADPARGNVRGYMLTKASYLLAMDNLCDLTHVQFVHEKFQSSTVFEDLVCEMRQDGDTVTTLLTFPEGPVPFAFRSAVPDPELAVDLVQEVRWDAPATAKLTARAYPPGQRGEPLFHVQSAHLVSPETATSCHYFYCNSRDFAVGDAAVDEHIRQWQKIGFNQEDKPMLEAQQRNLGEHDVMDLRPVLLGTDVGAVRMRRVLKGLIDAELAAAGAKVC